MDSLWHAAILDTKFYANLQAALGLTLHHNPFGADESQGAQRKERLRTMNVLYKTLFGASPLLPLFRYPKTWVHGQLIRTATMQITCKTLIGAEDVYRVHPSYLIETVKSMIYDRTGTPPDDQRLIFEGIQLGDRGRTLSDYQVHPGDVIHMVSRLRGC